MELVAVQCNKALPHHRICPCEDRYRIRQLGGFMSVNNDIFEAVLQSVRTGAHGSMTPAYIAESLMNTAELLGLGSRTANLSAVSLGKKHPQTLVIHCLGSCSLGQPAAPAA